MFATRARVSFAVVCLLKAAVLAALSDGCGSGSETSATTVSTAASAATSASTAATAPRATITITDQAGRQVTIPDPIKTVFCTSPMGTNLMYTLAPDLLVGWNIKPTALEKEYIPQSIGQSSGWMAGSARTRRAMSRRSSSGPGRRPGLRDLDHAAKSDANRIRA